MYIYIVFIEKFKWNQYYLISRIPHYTICILLTNESNNKEIYNETVACLESILCVFIFLYFFKCCSRKCSNTPVATESDKKTTEREDGRDNVFIINVKNTPLQTRTRGKCVFARLLVELIRGISIFAASREVLGCYVP
jgi:hypothetical protein